MAKCFDILAKLTELSETEKSKYLQFEYPCHHYASLLMFVLQLSSFNQLFMPFQNNENILFYSTRPLYTNIRNVGGKDKISVVL